MQRELHYGTVSEAIKAFKERGFTLDYNLAENCLICNGEKLMPDDFEIVPLFMVARCPAVPLQLKLP